MPADDAEAVHVPGLDEGLLERLTKFRAALSERAEPAFEEQETAATVARFLRDEAGLEPIAHGIAGHGLLYRVQGAQKGRSSLLRAELDGLDLEGTGRRHACGHDGHMAILTGALALAARDPDALPGTLYGLFQPAEETGEGAARALQEERVAALEVDAAYALHNLPGLPLGRVSLRPGVMACASVGVHVRFVGAVSHAAAPHRGRNPIPALAQLALRSEALVAVVVPFGEPALVTPIHMDVGKEAYGTAAGSGSARFTLRAASEEHLRSLVARLRREAEGIAQGHGLACSIEEVEPFPATVNDEAATRSLHAAARAAGLEVEEPPRPMAWSEDFGHIAAKWPAALCGLGSGENQPELHRAEYDFPDALIASGVRLWWALLTQDSRGGSRR